MFVVVIIWSSDKESNTLVYKLQCFINAFLHWANAYTMAVLGVYHQLWAKWWWAFRYWHGLHAEDQSQQTGSSDQSQQISVMQRRGLEKLIVEGTIWESWAKKEKINAYFKTMKVFFWPCMHVNLLLGTPKTKIWTFITHNGFIF